MKCQMCKKHVDEVEENVAELVFEWIDGFTNFYLCENCADKVRSYIENYYKKKKEEEEQIFYQ